MSYTIKDIVDSLGGTIDGDISLSVNGVGTLEEAKSGQITFLANPRYRQLIETSNASIIVVSKELDCRPKANQAFIRTDNPYHFFTKIVQKYFDTPKNIFKGVSKHAFVSETAHIADTASIGPYSYIGDNAHVGENAIIYPSCFVGTNSVIGQGTILYANVSVRENVTIGKNCIMHSGVVIGSDGFGFAFGEGQYSKFPQIGNVIIEDNVELGANTCVDRGAIGDTVIEQGTKVDNLVQIAHNVRIGANTVIAGGTAIAGSAKIGKNCIIGGHAAVAGHLKIADNVTITGKAGVTRSIFTPGVTYSGFPARPHKEWLKEQATVKIISKEKEK